MSMNEPHALYLAALAADEHYSAMLLKHEYDNRWAYAHAAEVSEVYAAYLAKVQADEAWLAFMRADSLQRTAAKASLRMDRFDTLKEQERNNPGSEGDNQ